MKDTYTEHDAAILIGAASLSADNTPGAVDLQGYDAARIDIAIGAGGITFDATNKIEFVLTHSDDDSAYVNVTDDDILGVTGITSGIIHSLVAAHAAATVESFGYVGNKRYLKLLADFSGTHGAGTPISAVCLKGHGRLKPPVGE
jgi:hypothetical protein